MRTQTPKFAVGERVRYRDRELTVKGINYPDPLPPGGLREKGPDAKALLLGYYLVGADALDIFVTIDLEDELQPL